MRKELTRKSFSSKTLKRQRKRYIHIETVKEEDRPKTRADCASVPRPCPYVGCRYHLAIDVRRSGSLVIIDNLPESCALDVAEKGSHTLEAVGELIGITRQGASQILEKAYAKLRNECIGT